MKTTPQSVIERLRQIRDEISDEMTAMSAAQRRDLRNRTKSSPELISTSISAINSSDAVAAATGRTYEKVLETIDLGHSWDLAESELRGLLNIVSSANLQRRYELDLMATQTFAVTKQLVRSPKNQHLIPIFESMQELRKVRKKRAPATPEDIEDQMS
ncbi:MAG TPA: hypothetical protein VF381_11475 [Thermoanaerobaculia bacterium]